MEALGARVDWEPQDQTVAITRGSGASVKLWIDNRLVYYEDTLGGVYDVCDVAPRIINSRTYVPLRLVINAVGLGISWDEQTGLVYVDTGAGGGRGRFFDLSIVGAAPGQAISGSLPLALNYGIAGGPPAGAAQVRYYLLDTRTGDGMIAASALDANGNVMLAPDPAIRGPVVLAAAVFDAGGNFLAGVATPVFMQPEPRLSLTGLTEGQSMAGPLEIGAALNFRAVGVYYEFTEMGSGAITRSEQADPTLLITHTPPAGQAGDIAVRAVAHDAAGNIYTSAPVVIRANVPLAASEPAVNLRSFSADNVGKLPVTLSITRNFDAITTQYWARNVADGRTVLLDEKPWGDFSWFPGPDMAGEWAIYASVTAPGGRVYTSNTRRAVVSPTPSIILGGIGPGQVITGEVKMHSTANVALQNVDYTISNPFNGTQRVLGSAVAAAEQIAWTPEPVNEGERRIYATGTMTNGQTITSEVLTVRVYLGEFHSAKPVSPREEFISLITPMALATQRRTGMSAALQVAQAILETGWGQSLPVDRYTGQFSYNLFGIKGSGSAGSVLSATWEEYYGTRYRTDDHFRAYNNILESWDDHGDLLLRLGRYQPYRDVMFHSASGAHALRRCGYATDSTYADKLIAIIGQYGLSGLDRQAL